MKTSTIKVTVIDSSLAEAALPALKNAGWLKKGQYKAFRGTILQGKGYEIDKYMRKKFKIQTTDMELGGVYDYYEFKYEAEVSLRLNSIKLEGTFSAEISERAYNIRVKILKENGWLEKVSERINPHVYMDFSEITIFTKPIVKCTQLDKKIAYAFDILQAEDFKGGEYKKYAYTHTEISNKNFDERRVVEYFDTFVDMVKEVNKIWFNSPAHNIINMWRSVGYCWQEIDFNNNHYGEIIKGGLS